MDDDQVINGSTISSNRRMQTLKSPTYNHFRNGHSVSLASGSKLYQTPQNGIDRVPFFSNKAGVQNNYNLQHANLRSPRATNEPKSTMGFKNDMKSRSITIEEPADMRSHAATTINGHFNTASKYDLGKTTAG